MWTLLITSVYLLRICVLRAKNEVLNLMNTSNITPLISSALVESLDAMFPDSCPRLDDKDRMVWFRAGQRAVVDYLIEQHKRQNETILGQK